MRIFHPRPELGAQKFIGVQFRDGVAVVDELHPETEAAMVLHGFTFEVEGVPLESLTVAELRDVAETEGIDFPARASKQKLIELISAAPHPTITDQGIVDAIDAAAPLGDKFIRDAWNGENLAIHSEAAPESEDQQ